MELAEDARVDILKKNIEKVKTGKTNPKIDKLKKNEKIDVKTGQEVSKEKAENFAKMISEGEESD
jgi:ribosomal protein L19E